MVRAAVGKTELIRMMIAGFNGKIFSGTGDNQEVRELLSAQKLSQLQTAFGSYQLLFIDEAQRIPEVGYALKLLIDHFPEMIILVTGSSSFDLSNKIGEPLTGRNTLRNLFPISILELYQQFGGMYVLQKLENLLIYGAYPDVLNATSAEDKKEYLISIRDSYLLKDILELESIKNPFETQRFVEIAGFPDRTGSFVKRTEQ